MSLHPEVRKHFSKLGKKGGKSRAKRHSKEELSTWAKKGGRPKGKVDGKSTQ